MKLEDVTQREFSDKDKQELPDPWEKLQLPEQSPDLL
jgi:hypothetical protein